MLRHYFKQPGIGNPPTDPAAFVEAVIESCLETVQSTNKLLAMERDGHLPVDEERLWLQHSGFMLGILAEYVTKKWGWPLVFD